MNKKIIRDVLFLGLGISVTLLFVKSESPISIDEIPQSEKVEISHTTLEKPLETLESLKDENKTESDAYTKNKKKSQIKKQSKTIAEVGVENREDQYFDESNVLIGDAFNKSIESIDFQEVISKLSKDLSETSLLRRQEVFDTLNSLPSLSNHDFQSTCGNGVCAIIVPNVESVLVQDISDDVLNSLDSPISFNKEIKNEDGYSEYRILLDANPNRASVLKFSANSDIKAGN